MRQRTFGVLLVVFGVGLLVGAGTGGAWVDWPLGGVVTALGVLDLLRPGRETADSVSEETVGGRVLRYFGLR